MPKEWMRNSRTVRAIDHIIMSEGAEASVVHLTASDANRNGGVEILVHDHAVALGNGMRHLENAVRLGAAGHECNVPVI
jgi:hypothetical protein